MAILKIARMGHPVLAHKAEPVPDPAAPQVKLLVQNMLETMVDAEGTGLAAPQIHVPRRVVVFKVERGRSEQEDGEAAQGVPLTVLINPEIEPLGEEKSLGWEGCLSVPGLMGEVPRYEAIRYRAWDLEGQPFEREARGFHARVVQHECDHLDGILYPQRMIDMSRLIFTSESRHLAAQGRHETTEEGE